MRRVLVVDDEPHIRTVLRGYLEADGLAVRRRPTEKRRWPRCARIRPTWCCWT